MQEESEPEYPLEERFLAKCEECIKDQISDLEEILLAEDQTAHYSFSVSLVDVWNSIEGRDVYPLSDVYPSFVKNPLNLDACDEILKRAAKYLITEHPRKSEMILKPNLHIRFIPFGFFDVRHNFPNSSDFNIIISVQGTVVRTTSIKMLLREKEFMCNKCKHVFTVKATFYTYYRECTPPGRCPNPKGCKATKFKCLTGTEFASNVCSDYQEIRIQEQAQKLPLGTIPRSMWVVLEDDLVDSCKAGDDVIIFGVVKRRWGPLKEGVRPKIETAIRANAVSVKNLEMLTSIEEDEREAFEEFWEKHKHTPLTARNLIVSSFCPQIYGLYVVKLAISMVMVGGVEKMDGSGTRIRGQSHLLLVGDPGTGKSQFLKFAAKVSPRSIYTTGIGSTTAGLTVAAIKDEGEWQLEAGALVLADGGVCCIDEFNSIRESDKACIHEAMEQQTISVAKAGMVCKLNSRTTILAATNPKGRYDSGQSLSVNVALGSPLLSRFDLVMVLLDSDSEEWDHIISSFILFGRDEITKDQSIWDVARMKNYFRFARAVKPQMTEKAYSVLARYYQAQRKADQGNAARTTIRMLESMIRLSEAHARLLCHPEVEVMDAVVAVSVMEQSMQGAALICGSNVLHTAFPDDSEEEYRNQAEVILTHLGLQDLLAEELKMLDELRKHHQQELEEAPSTAAATAQAPSWTQGPPPPGDSCTPLSRNVDLLQSLIDRAEERQTQYKMSEDEDSSCRAKASSPSGCTACSVTMETGGGTVSPPLVGVQIEEESAATCLTDSVGTAGRGGGGRQSWRNPTAATKSTTEKSTTGVTELVGIADDGGRGQVSRKRDHQMVTTPETTIELTAGASPHTTDSVEMEREERPAANSRINQMMAPPRARKSTAAKNRTAVSKSTYSHTSNSATIEGASSSLAASGRATGSSTISSSTLSKLKRFAFVPEHQRQSKKPCATREGTELERVGGFPFLGNDKLDSPGTASASQAENWKLPPSWKKGRRDDRPAEKIDFKTSSRASIEGASSSLANFLKKDDHHQKIDSDEDW